VEVRQNIILAVLFFSLAGLSAWLQFGLLASPESDISQMEKNDPDYYVENLVVTGMDESGEKYKVIAERMAHYPLGDRVLLDNPHIVQYDLDGTLRHIYAESGRLYNNRATVLLTGNVRVIETGGGGDGGAMSTDKMTIHLK